MNLISLLYSEKTELFFNKNKVLIFSILSMVFITLIFYFTVNSKNLNKENRVIQLTQIVDKFKKKDKNIDLLVTVASMEKYIEKNNIELLSMKLLEKGFFLELKGEYQSTIKIIDLIEKKNSLLKIEKMNLSHDDAKTLVNLSLDVKVLKEKRFYKNNENITLVNIFNEEVQAKDIKQNKEIKREKFLKLYAIVENKAFVNNHWFKVGEYIDDKKVVFIGEDFISLESKNSISKLRMYENGIIR